LQKRRKLVGYEFNNKNEFNNVTQNENDDDLDYELIKSMLNFMSNENAQGVRVESPSRAVSEGSPANDNSPILRRRLEDNSEGEEQNVSTVKKMKIAEVSDRILKW
jgi:hypothetical protein